MKGLAHMSHRMLQAVTLLSLLASTLIGCSGSAKASKEDIQKVQKELPPNFRLEMGGGDTTESGDASVKGAVNNP